MNRFFKKLMIWLLLAVLPIQGIAAATMISCGPAHKASVAGMMSITADHHATVNAAPEAAPAGAAHALAGDQVHHHATKHADDEHKHATSSCSACGVCTVGAGLLPSMPDWTLRHDGAEPVLMLPEFTILSHIPAGLERPPQFPAI